jgi:uncharacterized membrane-anchored protein
MFARRSIDLPSTAAVARVDRRTKNLVTRIQPGEIAVIDHEDIDRMAAEQLLERRVGGIVNASRCISGRYPTEGPLLLVAKGVPVIDGVGPAVLDAVEEGRLVRLVDNEVWVGNTLVTTGTRQTMAQVQEDFDRAKHSLGDELARFAVNTLEYLRDAPGAMLTAVELPELSCTMGGRQVLLVARGRDYKKDLAALRSYVREMRPLIMAVDGGADAVLEMGLEPDLIIGDFDSVSTRALRCGAELVAHAYPGGDAPGAERLRQLGVPHHVFEAPGTSEDVAMLLAHDAGAELIVAVGSHVSMVEFLDKGRAGMASTFLVRLKVQHLLVDARGVSRLYRSRIRKRDIIFLLAAVMLCVIAMVLVSAPLRVFLEGFRLVWRNFWHSLTR